MYIYIYDTYICIYIHMHTHLRVLYIHIHIYVCIYTYVHIYMKYIYIYIHIHIHTHLRVLNRRPVVRDDSVTLHQIEPGNSIRIIEQLSTGWRRPIGCLKLQVISGKRVTNHRGFLREMTCKDKASYGSSPLSSQDCITQKCQIRSE